MSTTERKITTNVKPSQQESPQPPFLSTSIREKTLDELKRECAYWDSREACEDAEDADTDSEY
jgi:hypothetical protein